MKVLVTGGKGQLGFELKKISLKKNSIKWLFTDRKSFDISDLGNIDVYLNCLNPDLIINCAAFTSVDSAEDNFDIANIVNHKAVNIIAKWCNDNGCKLFHISTDYVFDGNSQIPYLETDLTNPLNNYGKSKLLGETACQANNPSSIIIRTSWLYSSYGDNFVTNMINLMNENDQIKVVDDQFGCPTYAGDLADTLLQVIINNKWYPGIYHYTNSGVTSWYNFANEIKYIYGFSTIIKAIPTNELFLNSIRPKYSVLDNSKIINTFKIKQMNYLESLKKCVNKLQNEL
jgi:dTDP-4-dehydrorhamnose reductase